MSANTDSKAYAFIDASNLFYGGEKSLGWKVDYEKLLEYLRNKYNVSKAFYYGGIEIHDFPHDYQNNHSVSLKDIEKHFLKLLDQPDRLSETDIVILGRHLKRVRFYKKLEIFNYHLCLKPVKIYKGVDGMTSKKANCDVDMT